MLFINFYNIIFSNEYLYTDKLWLVYSNLISLFLITIFIILLGIILLNKANHVKFLNLMSAYYLIIFFFLISLNYSYNFFNLNLYFNQNITLFVNLFIFISTITVLIFFLGISDIFYIEENSKIEFSLLVWFIYISSNFLVSSSDFISIIILLECITFSSYILVGFDRKNKFSTTSALKYLILASIPSGIFILGISLLYNNYGTFSYDYLNILLQIFLENPLIEISKNESTFLNLWKYIQEYSFNYFLNNNFIFIQDFIIFTKTLSKLFSIITPYVLISLNIEYENYLYILISDLSFVDPHALKPIWEMNLFFYSENHFIDNLASFYIAFQQLWLFQHTLELICEILNISRSTFFEDFELILRHIQDWYRFIFRIEYNLWSLPMEDFLFRKAELGNTHPYEGYSFAILYDGALNNSLARGLHLDEIEYSFLEKNDIKVDSYLKIMYTLDKDFNFFMSSLKEHYNYFISNFFYNQTTLNPIQNFYFELVNDYLLYYELISNFNLIISLKPLNYSHFFITFFEHNSFYYQDNFLIIFLIIFFILTNICFKLTAAPFHLWAPSVYGGSPLATLTFLSIFSKLTIIFFTLFLFINIFDSLSSIWQPILLLISFLSIISSILGAFSEKLFKRFFIYSSMGHVGFILTGIAVLNIEGIKASVDYLLLYILSSFLIWFIIMHLTKKTTTLINLKGLSYNQPYLSLIFSITIFSLSGLPPMGGFFVKYEIFYSIMNSSFFYFGYLLLILTVISFFYYLRIIKIMFFENNYIFTKDKNLSDIKLRLISLGFFLIPLFMVFAQNSLGFLLKEILINSLR